MKTKNLLLYEAIAVFALFSIIYFVVANKVSYAFAYDENAALYESKINVISKGAQVYGETNLSLFDEDDTIYVTVDELIKNGYIMVDETGKIKDPTSDVKYMNDLKVRISLKNGKVTTKVLK